MIFQPSKKVFIDKDDYFNVLVKLASVFLRDSKTWLDDHEIDYLKWAIRAQRSGIKIASRQFVPWMVENSPYTKLQSIYNGKATLTRKKWMVKSEHGIMFPKVLTDFLEGIDRGDKALECRFMMDYVPDKPLDELRVLRNELHPLTEERVNRKIKIRGTETKERRKEIIKKAVALEKQLNEQEIVEVEE